MKKRAAKKKSKASAKAPKNKAVPAKIDWRTIRVTTEQAGAAVKIGAERIRQLTKLGFIEKIGTNEYLLGAVFDGFIRYRDEQAAKAAEDTESSKLAAARRREIDIRIAKDEGRLVEAEDVQALISEMVGTFVTELRGVPAGATRDLEVRAAIERVLNGAIDRCRESLGKLGADLRSGRGIVFRDEDTDT